MKFLVEMLRESKPFAVVFTVLAILLMIKIGLF